MNKEMMRWVFSILCIAVFLPVFSGCAEEEVQYRECMIWDLEYAEHAEKLEIDEAGEQHAPDRMVEIDRSQASNVEFVVSELEKEGNEYEGYYYDGKGSYVGSLENLKDVEEYRYIVIYDWANDCDVWVGKLRDENANGAEPEGKLVLRFHPYQQFDVQPVYIWDIAQAQDASIEASENGEPKVTIGIGDDGNYVLYTGADADYVVQHGDVPLEENADQKGFIVPASSGDLQIYWDEIEIGTIPDIDAPQNWVTPKCEIKGIDVDSKSVQIALDMEAAKGYDTSKLQWKYCIVRGEEKSELQEIPVKSLFGETIDLEGLKGLRAKDVETNAIDADNTLVDADITAIEIGLYEGENPVSTESILSIGRDDFFPVVELDLGEDPKICDNGDGNGSIEGEIVVLQGKNHLGDIAGLRIGGVDEPWELDMTASEDGYRFVSTGKLPKGESLDVELGIAMKGDEAEDPSNKEDDQPQEETDSSAWCGAENKGVKVRKTERIVLEDARITLHGSTALAEGTVRLENMEGVSAENLKLSLGKDGGWKDYEAEFESKGKNVFSFVATSTGTVLEGEEFVLRVVYGDKDDKEGLNQETVQVKKMGVSLGDDCKIDERIGDTVKISGTMTVGKVDIAADQLKLVVIEEKSEKEVQTVFTGEDGKETDRFEADKSYNFDFEYELQNPQTSKLSLRFLTDEGGAIGDTNLVVPEKPVRNVKVSAEGVSEKYDAEPHGIQVKVALSEGEPVKISADKDGSFEAQLDKETIMKGKVQYREAQTEEWSDGLPEQQKDVGDQTYQIKLDAEGFKPQYENGEDGVEATISIQPFEVCFAAEATPKKEYIYNGEKQEIEFDFDVSEVKDETAKEMGDALQKEVEALKEELKEKLNAAYAKNKIVGTDAGDYREIYTVESDSQNIVLKDGKQTKDGKLTVEAKATIDKQSVRISLEPAWFVYDGEEHQIGTENFKGEIEEKLDEYKDGYTNGIIKTKGLNDEYTKAVVYPVELGCDELNKKAQNHSYSIDPWYLVILRQSFDPKDTKKENEQQIEKEVKEVIEKGAGTDLKIDDFGAYYAGMTVELKAHEAIYNGNSQEPKLIFKQDGAIKTLEQDTDYTLSYFRDAERKQEEENPSFASAGTWYISVTGMGNYAGTIDVEKPYTINKSDKAKAEVSIEGWTYDGLCAGSDAHPLIVSSESGEQYEAVYYDEEGNKIDDAPSNAGEYRVEVTWPATENYAEASASAEFTIEPVKLDDVSIEQEQQVAYTGEDQYPSISVQYGDITLEEGRDGDYMVNPDGNVRNVGDASVRVVGIGNYAGSRRLEYEIVAVEDEKASVTIDGEWIYDGMAAGSDAHPIQFYSSNGEVQPKITYYLNEDAVDPPKSVGEYKVVAEWEAAGNYAAASAEASFKITPAEVVIHVKPVEKVFGDQDPKLKAEVSVNGGEDKRTIVESGAVELLGDDECAITLTRAAGEDAGVYPISAKYEESGNYTYRVEEAKLEIKQRELTKENVVLPEGETYDTTEHKPVVMVGDEILEIDEDYTLELTKGNDYSSSGEKVVVCTGRGNYSGSVSVSYEIENATGSMQLTNLNKGALTAVRGEDGSESVHISGTIQLEEPLKDGGSLSIQIDGEEKKKVEASELAENGTEYAFDLDMPVEAKTKTISVSATALYDGEREVQIEVEGVEGGLMSVAHELNKMLFIGIAAAAVSLIGLITCLCLRAKTAKKIRQARYRELSEDSLRSNRTIYQEEDD